MDGAEAAHADEVGGRQQRPTERGGVPDQVVPVLLLLPQPPTVARAKMEAQSERVTRCVVVVKFDVKLQQESLQFLAQKMQDNEKNWLGRGLNLWVHFSISSKRAGKGGGRFAQLAQPPTVACSVGSSVGMCTRCVHVFCTFQASTCVPSRCLLAKFLRRSSVGSLLRVRCWLGEGPCTVRPRCTTYLRIVEAVVVRKRHLHQERGLGYEHHPNEEQPDHEEPGSERPTLVRFPTKHWCQN